MKRNEEEMEKIDHIEHSLGNHPSDDTKLAANIQSDSIPPESVSESVHTSVMDTLKTAKPKIAARPKISELQVNDFPVLGGVVIFSRCFAGPPGPPQRPFEAFGRLCWRPSRDSR